MRAPFSGRRAAARATADVARQERARLGPDTGHEVSDNATPMPSMRESRSRLGRLARFIRPHRREFRLSVATAVLTTALTTIIPLLFKNAIDEGITTGDVEAARSWALVAGVAAVAGWAFLMANVYTAFWSVKVLADLRLELYRHVNRQALGWFERMRTGTVISRLVNDVDSLAQLVNDGVFMVFVNFLQLLIIEIILFALDWRLALAANVIFPIMLVATIAFRYYSSRAYRRTRERMAQVTAYLAENISGMRVVQAFAAEDRAAEEFDRTNEHYRKANMETIWLSAAYFPGVELLSAMGTAIVLWYGGLLSSDGLVTVGVLFAFIAYLDNFFQPIQQLSQFYGSFLSAMAALDKIMGVLESRPTIVDKPDARRIDDLRGEVRFEHVSFRYREDTPIVLEDIDLEVPAGQSVALVGHTGAGKSTFVRLLTRFYDPTEGGIRLDGVDLRDLEQTWLRRTMGIVPQEGFLFSTTVRENIAYGRPGASDADVRAAAETVGADEFISELEDGYDTHVGERGGRLSAGQRQQVAFARALLADPKLLVLDEATSSVDVATELRLSEGLRRLVAGRTAFIVAHRLSTIRDADRILVVDDGRIVEQGTHDELLEADGHFARLYGTWSGDEHEATIEERLDEQPADEPAT